MKELEGLCLVESGVEVDTVASDLIEPLGPTRPAPANKLITGNNLQYRALARVMLGYDEERNI